MDLLRVLCTTLSSALVLLHLWYKIRHHLGEHGIYASGVSCCLLSFAHLPAKITAVNRSKPNIDIVPRLYGVQVACRHKLKLVPCFVRCRVPFQGAANRKITDPRQHHHHHHQSPPSTREQEGCTKPLLNYTGLCFPASNSPPLQSHMSHAIPAMRSTWIQMS